MKKAIKEGIVNCLTFLLENGAEILNSPENHIIHHYFEILLFSPIHTQVNVLTLLLTHGLDPHYTQDGDSSIHMALQKTLRRPDTNIDITNIIQILLIHGVQINTFHTNGSTELHYAFKIGKFDLLKLLVENGANVNLYCKGFYPIHQAVQSGVEQIFFFFLNRVTNVNVEDKNGHTALDHVIVNLFKKEAVSLISRGAIISTEDKNQETAFQFLLKHSRPSSFQNDMIQLIVSENKI